MEGGDEARLRLRRPSPAIVVALVALVVAMGGIGYAALKLPKNSVGSKQIKKNAVNSAKVKNGSLRARDFKPGQLPAGPQGPEGPKGDPGSPATDVAHANTADTATNADKLDDKDSTTFAPAGSEAWKAATLNDGEIMENCNWRNFGGTQNPAGYFRDSSGVVHLRGLVHSSSGDSHDCTVGSAADLTVTQLPVGYRPDHDWAFATISDDKPGRVNVNPQGAVLIEPNFPTFTDAHQWVSLDGLTFRCAPSGQDGCP